MKTLPAGFASLFLITATLLRAQEASAYRAESTSTSEVFSTKVLKVFSVQESGAEYVAYVVDWRSHEVVVTPFPGQDADTKLKPGDTVRCQMMQTMQRVGDSTTTRMMFSLIPNRMNVVSFSPVDDARRMDAVAAEVQARRVQRDAAAQQLATGAARVPLPVAPATDDKVIAAVRAADAERVAATKAGDSTRLDAIYSNDLRYAHSSGHVDTKASYMKALTSHATVYESYDYKEQTFTPVAPGVALMTGRVLIHARNASGANDLDLNFLAVWREEGGKWRFLAWQSCKNPPPAPAAK